MNEIEEAIREIRHTKQFYSSEKNFDLAIQALEKQIPKKPLEFNVLQNNFGKLLYKRGKCPICGEKMINDINYCSNCGQAIDWSDSE